MSLFHPSLRIPAWVAVAVVAAAYVVRSVMRGWDFRPDAPFDYLVLVTLVALLVLREVLRRRGWAPGDDARDPPDGPGRDERDR